MHTNCLRVMVRKADMLVFAMEEKLLNICYNASTVGNRNFNHILPIIPGDAKFIFIL